ncbi:hypothetical protein HAX54_033736 [Datura stramonium]|uniref:Leucine-rich repeat-containing N-terminal plant-type domain-containing protein n=1 Tax=Datura stramonium TaxID=4076 RepID=A0ABS8SEI1_DATST|nr:hypothetical protein [Datura stramonium]
MLRQIKWDENYETLVKKDLSGIYGPNTDNWGNWHFNATLFLPFKNLKALLLRGHSLANWIPNEGFDKLKQLAKLERLDLAGNNFNRSIFLSLSRLTSLKSLNLRSNNLQSGIGRLSGLSNLEILDLSGNFLNDESVRSALDLGTLRNLKYLLLDGNALDKDFLQSSGVMSSLKVLSVSNCNLNGTLPIQGLCDLKYLEELSLGFNNFHGNLPPCLGNLTLLRVIDLSQNQFTGNIASSPLSSLLSLEYLLLKDNNFEIPISFESFANHSNLKYVIPDDNSLVVQTSVTSWIPKFQLEALSLTNNCSEMPNFLHYQHNLRQLSLSKCNMGGNFPNWLLENNPRLEELYLDGNAFTGTLQLSFLPNLKTFDISNNKIQGQLPPNMGFVFPNILRLKMSNNMLEGMLPSSFGDMKNLQCLDLSDNKLSGDLPIDLARNGSKLFFLRLSNNLLGGEIFPASTDISSFQYLYLDGNNFSGPISQKLSSAPLSSLDLSNNNLSGNVPSWIGYIPSLTSLSLSNNNLKGPIPVDYCRLEGLEVLDLSINNIVGVVPSCFRASQNLKRVYLSKNNLQGQFDVFSNSSDLKVLDLRDNNFSGSIPKWLGSTLEITTLLLKGNQLQGTIPTELCHASKLRIMDLSHNNLSGPIPHCFGNIMQLTGARELYPYGPRFYFPGFQTWGRDAMVYVEDSMVRSTIHFQVNYAWVGADFTTKHNTYSYEGRVLDYMAGIDLSYNQLSGEIPKELCNLTEIRALNLSRNHIIGTILSEFSNLRKIESLDLSYNKLSGRIPPQLVELTSLAVFSVAHNNLTGMTPQLTSQFATFSESSYEGNPFLCGPPLHVNCMETKEIPISPPDIDCCKDDTDFLDTESFYISFLVAYANVVLTLDNIKPQIVLKKYYSRGSDYLSSWAANETSDCCQWEGIVCSNTTRRVTELSINSREYSLENWLFNASLFIPFKDLKALLLPYNSLVGWAKNEGFEKLRQLRKLESLDLSWNRLNDSIFESLSWLSSLKSLNLASNNFGSGFEKLRQLRKLESLDLSGNQLNGNIFESLSWLSSLKSLNLAYNNIESGFEKLRQLRKLETLDLSRNKFNRNIFESLSQLSSLKSLSLAYNYIQSGIEKLSRLDKQEILDLSYNRLDDENGLCDLKYLEELSLRGNSFTGTLPTCLGNFTFLRVIDLSNNQFTGNIASSPLSSLFSLEYLLLADNNFEIPISFEPFSNHSKLKFVTADKNSVTVQTNSKSWIPKFQLEAFTLSNCSQIPSFLHYQHHLRLLVLSKCNIGGDFPNWLLENNSRLEDVRLDGNAFAGSLQLPFLPNLKLFHISNNKIHFPS